jgi:transcription termination factor 2
VSVFSLLSECLDLNELQRMKSDTEDVESLMQNLTLDSSNKSVDDLNVLGELKNGADGLEVCLNKTYLGAKLAKLLEMVDSITENNEGDKIIIVSQWTSVLNIIGYHLKARNLEFYEIRGDVNLFKRNELVESFNKPYNVKIMLLPLNAGGIGLNLISANRMFLLDIHGNPALEQQAGDRVYRVGQKKNVNIYRFICDNTIEERI